MYSSSLLLAIPLFILAAEFMNSGAIMERLLRFCNALVGRFRGGMAHVNVLQSVVFSAMSGSALADAASSGKIMQIADDAGRPLSARLRRGADGGFRGDGAGHPAVHSARDFRADLRHLDRLSCCSAASFPGC